MRAQLELWTRSGLTDVIEEWRQRQVARMFSLSEFVRWVKLRFTRWHNRKHGRRGTNLGGYPSNQAPLKSA